MKKLLTNILTCTFAALLLSASHSIAQNKQENKVDLQKLYEDIAGTYNFEANGRSVKIEFRVEGEQLLGKPENATRSRVLTLVKGEELKFDISDEDDYFVFVRNDNKEIDKVRLHQVRETEERVINGKKIKDK